MQGSISRIGSARTAVLLIPILYSAIHFFGGAAPIPYAAVTPGSGFTMLAESLRVFANPQQIADAFLALHVVGVLLALIRLHWTACWHRCRDDCSPPQLLAPARFPVDIHGQPLRPHAGHMGDGGCAGGLLGRLDYRVQGEGIE
jgi:hypothetical protein